MTEQATSADGPVPPSPAQLYGALLADFGPKGWEIRFDGANWHAFRPGYIALHASSALALRDAIDVAQPRPLTPAHPRLLRENPEVRARQPAVPEASWRKP